MGCDIHQINLMEDSSGKTWLLEGEIDPEADAKYEYVDEFIDGRCYDLFGILAGVRAEDFQIESNVNTYIPDELPEKIKKHLEDRDYCYHSFTWYYLSDLLDELKWTKKKMKMYLKARAFNDPCFISGGEIDEFRWNIRAVKEWIISLEKTREKLKSEGREEDFKTSKVFFFFDS